MRVARFAALTIRLRIIAPVGAALKLGRRKIDQVKLSIELESHLPLLRFGAKPANEVTQFPDTQCKNFRFDVAVNDDWLLDNEFARLRIERRALNRRHGAGTTANLGQKTQSLVYPPGLFDEVAKPVLVWHVNGKALPLRLRAKFTGYIKVYMRMALT